MTDTIERALAAIRFDRDGLVPAVAQQHDTGEILMVAWMNRDAVRATLTEGRVCYWSRSRRKLWRKGETSGQVQRLRELRLDCDGDTVLLLVDQHGRRLPHRAAQLLFPGLARGFVAGDRRSTRSRSRHPVPAKKPQLSQPAAGPIAAADTTRWVWACAIMSALKMRLAHCALYWLTSAL